MIFRGLRTRIIFNLLILLLAAMVLIDLVIVVTTQKQLIQSQAEKGQIALAMAARNLAANASEGKFQPAAVEKALADVLHTPDVACVTVVATLNGNHYLEGPRCQAGDGVGALALESARRGVPISRFENSAWGVFWQAPGEVAVSTPIRPGAQPLGGIAMVLELEPTYAMLRKSQKIFFIYIAINAILLTIVGVYRISRIYLSPLQRMARRAEAYRDGGELPFAVRQEDNELTLLSDALNQMIRRIAQDKDKLRKTVRSLEALNVDLKMAQEEVIRAEKLSTVGRLASGIAHEIGNPIGIVLGYLQLLKRSDVSDSEAQDYIARSEEEIQRINSIIRQLLGFSRPSAGAPAVISVNEAIAEVAQMLRVQPIMAGVEFFVRADAVPDEVYADPNQIRQVLINIILNAADAIADKTDDGTTGRVSLSCRVEGPADRCDETPAAQIGPAMIVVECGDNGIGIAENQQPNIFDPFYTTKGPRRGTGLGLYVSYMIVKAMGGRIEVFSTLGQGTTVSLYLPLCSPEPAEDEDRSAMPAVSLDASVRVEKGANEL